MHTPKEKEEYFMKSRRKFQRPECDLYIHI